MKDTQDKLIEIILALQKELPAVIEVAYKEGFHDGAAQTLSTTRMNAAQTWPNSQTYAQLVRTQEVRLQAIEALELLERVAKNMQPTVETIQ